MLTLLQNVRLRRNIKYCALQGIYWVIDCICIIFTSVYLLPLGYSNSEVGIILAAGYILGALLQPVICSWADRSVHLTPTAFLALTGLCAGCAVSVLAILGRKCAAAAVSYVLYIASLQVLAPLVNAYCFYMQTPDTPINFGIARGTGSMAWGITSSLMGILVARLGVSVLIYGQLLALGVLMAVLLLCRAETIGAAQKRQGEEHSPARKSELTVSSLLGRYRVFLFLLCGNALLFFGYAMVDNFPYQIISNVGGTSAQMGVYCGYLAILELPGMFLFDRLRRRFSDRQLLRWGAAFLFVRSFFLCLMRTLIGVYAASFFQVLSFGIFVPAAVHFAASATLPQDSNKAQSLVTTTTTVGNVLCSILGGMIIDAVSVRGALVVGAAASLAGMLFVLLGVRSKLKPN